MEKVFNKGSEKEKRRQLRSDMPPAEKKLWQHLRNKQLLGFRFRRQVSVGKYVVDFYCAEAKLVIEIDGDSHSGNEAYDSARQHFIESFGVRFLRFTNCDISESIEGVVGMIEKECRRITSTSPGPS